MADYATNLFFASTENERDLDKVEAFLDDNFADCFIERSEDMLDAQFSSLWVYPEKEIDKLVESLDAKDEIYIRILTYALKDEYVSFRTFSQGTWNIKFNLNAQAMYEYEEKSDIIGSPCSLMNPYKGYTEGTIVGDYGNTVVVRLTSGKEIVEFRDEVIIYN